MSGYIKGENRHPLILAWLSAIMIVACGSDPDEPVQSVGMSESVIVQQGLLDSDWTLETIRGNDGEYRPLPLDATWRLSFQAEGRVAGDALCNAGGGRWEADDTTLTIFDWNEDAAFCPESETIPTTIKETVARLFSSDTMMPRIEAERLFFDTGDNVQLVFSGRLKQTNERNALTETLVRSGGFARASDGNPLFGDLATPYVIYRDTASLEADYAALPAEGSPWPELPVIDFTSSIVVGAYLPLDGQVSSDVVVRGARVGETGLEIETARFGPNVLDEASVVCAADDALTAPWTLVRIESIVEPVHFAEMARAFCSGIPASD